MSPAIATIVLVGLLDSASGVGLRQQVVDALERGDKTIAIDCRAITLMDSNGFSSLVVCLKKTRESAARLILIGPTAQMNLVLEMTGTDSIFLTVASPDMLNQLAAAPKP